VTHSRLQDTAALEAESAVVDPVSAPAAEEADGDVMHALRHEAQLRDILSAQARMDFACVSGVMEQDAKVSFAGRRRRRLPSLRRSCRSCASGCSQCSLSHSRTWCLCKRSRKSKSVMLLIDFDRWQDDARGLSR